MDHPFILSVWQPSTGGIRKVTSAKITTSLLNPRAVIKRQGKNVLLWTWICDNKFHFYSASKIKLRFGLLWLYTTHPGRYPDDRFPYRLQPTNRRSLFLNTLYVRNITIASIAVSITFLFLCRIFSHHHLLTCSRWTCPIRRRVVPVIQETNLDKN